MPYTMKFMVMVCAAFFARVKPVSTSAKPACMNITRKPATSVQTKLMATVLASMSPSGVLGVRRFVHDMHDSVYTLHHSSTLQPQRVRQFLRYLHEYAGTVPLGEEGELRGGTTFNTGPGSARPPTRSRGRCTPAIPPAWPPRTARRYVTPGRHGPRRPCRACPTPRGGRAGARQSGTCAARGSSSRRCSCSPDRAE